MSPGNVPHADILWLCLKSPNEERKQYLSEASGHPDTCPTPSLGYYLASEQAVFGKTDDLEAKPHFVVRHQKEVRGSGAKLEKLENILRSRFNVSRRPGEV